VGDFTSSERGGNSAARSRRTPATITYTRPPSIWASVSPALPCVAGAASGMPHYELDTAHVTVQTSSPVRVLCNLSIFSCENVTARKLWEDPEGGG